MFHIAPLPSVQSRSAWPKPLTYPPGRPSFITRVLGVDSGRLLGTRAGRGAPRLLKRPARLLRGVVSQRGVRPDRVVVVSPWGQLAADVRWAVEDLLVEVFVVEAAVEGLDVAVLLRLAGPDVVPFDLVVVRPFQDGLAGELGPVACWE